jgi:predicted nucleotidyltransferase
MTEELRKAIEQAAQTLKAYGAKEVYLFGSAATGTLREDSDIDMAVSGLPPEVFFRAWAKAVRAFPGREMDLVNLDHDEPFARYLKDEGELRRVG